MVGFLAYSLSGHDQNKIYAIIKEEKDYVWLVDGEIRTLDKPKKKNKKHIQIIKTNKVDEILSMHDFSVSNEAIKRAIKLYIKGIQEVK